MLLDGIIKGDFTRGYVNARHVFTIIGPDSSSLARSLSTYKDSSTVLIYNLAERPRRPSFQVSLKKSIIVSITSFPLRAETATKPRAGLTIFHLPATLALPRSIFLILSVRAIVAGYRAVGLSHVHRASCPTFLTIANNSISRKKIPSLHANP